MFQRFLVWFSGYALYALLGGLALLGMGAYAAYDASRGGGIPAEAQLTTQSGHISEGREVTLERKRRSGVKSSSKVYYELDFQPKAGEQTLLLRVDIDVPRDVLETIIEEDVSVKYDPKDDNTVYVIDFDGENLLSYADMARLMQQRADSEQAFWASPGVLGAGLLLALLGAGGLLWRRKMLAQEAQHMQQMHEQALAGQGGSMIGADLPPPAPPQ